MKPRGRPFQPGNTYGKGRPKGSRNRVTVLAQQIIESYSEPIIKRCVASAMEGKPEALRLCIDRLAPLRREVPIRIALPAAKTAQDIAVGQQVILDSIARGKITPGEGVILSDILEQRRKAIETVELERRIEELEKARADFAQGSPYRRENLDAHAGDSAPGGAS